jgi:hypothetical protein
MHGHDFGIAEFFAVSLATFIGHKNSVAVGNEILKLETVDPLAVWPAPRKICRAINAVIERTREMKVRGNQFLNGSTILRNVDPYAERAIAMFLSMSVIFSIAVFILSSPCFYFALSRGLLRIFFKLRQRGIHLVPRVCV